MKNIYCLLFTNMYNEPQFSALLIQFTLLEKLRSVLSKRNINSNAIHNNSVPFFTKFIYFAICVHKYSTKTHQFVNTSYPTTSYQSFSTCITKLFIIIKVKYTTKQVGTPSLCFTKFINLLTQISHNDQQFHINHFQPILSTVHHDQGKHNQK